MKTLSIAILGLSLTAAAAPPTAHATTCNANVLQLSSGPRVVFGSTNSFDVNEVRIVTGGTQLRQTIPVSNGRFAEVLAFSVEPREEMDVVFVRKDERVICLQSVVFAPVFERQVTASNGTNDGAAGN